MRRKHITYTRKKGLLAFLAFVFFILSSPFALSQSRVMDSLNTLLNSEKNDTNKLNIYIRLLDECNIKDNLKYAQPALTLADNLLVKANNNQTLKGNLLRKKAELYAFHKAYYHHVQDTVVLHKYRRLLFSVLETLRDTGRMIRALTEDIGDSYRSGNIFEAIGFYEKALKLSKQTNNKQLITRCIASMGLLCQENGDYKNALIYINKTIQYFTELKDSGNLAVAYRFKGKAYIGLNNTEEAIKNLERSLSFDRDKKSFLTMAVTANIGDAYQRSGNFSAAILSYQKAVRIAEEIKMLDSQANYLTRIANLYCRVNKFDSAIVYAEKSLKLSKKDSEQFHTANFSLVKTYSGLRNYTKAKTYIEPISEIVNKMGIREAIEVEELAYKIDSTLGNYPSAFRHYILYSKWKNKFNTDDIEKQVSKEKNQEQYEKQKAEQDQKNAEAQAESKKQRMILLFVSGTLLLIAVFAAFIFRNLRITQKQKTIIASQKQEVESQKEAVERQKRLVEEKQKEILDSITYAKRLQQAILPPEEFITKNFPSSFVLYRPKDIVAGDFYWAENINGLCFIAAADSTGHGVPGAMVSVVCSNALNRSVKEFGLTDSGKILDKTRELVIETFEKSNEEVKDGMDISLLCIDKKNKKIFWSGANNPLWYIQDNKLNEITADKQPIGKTEYPQAFTTHEIKYEENKTFYLFTDGFADQFGGPKGKKFKYKQFEETLVSINKQPMIEQAKIIDSKFEEWKGVLEQVDDVCVIGIKI